MEHAMQKDRDTILVAGATGNQGGAVIRELLANGYKVKAMTRNPAGEAAQALAAQGAEIVQADLDDPASLERALAGAWGVFAVQNTWEAGVEREEEQGKRIADVARGRACSTMSIPRSARRTARQGSPTLTTSGVLRR
jgi:uncharacterized protein YbjT (DUF2867 family)